MDYEQLREQLLNKLDQPSKLRNEVKQLEETLRNEAPILYACFNAIDCLQHDEEPPSKKARNDKFSMDKIY
jgi:hypothetical protein